MISKIVSVENKDNKPTYQNDCCDFYHVYLSVNTNYLTLMAMQLLLDYHFYYYVAIEYGIIVTSIIVTQH